ncbi:MAG: competence/damage-inducible protein A [Planctomycetia bacterium]
MRSASLLVVGDELLSGEIRDENTPWAIERLAREGVRVVRVALCPDSELEVAGEVRRLRALAVAVIVTGGVGPTHDDVTRPALARALGVGLVSHPEAERRIRGFYGQAVTPAELEMALLPAGARVVVGPTTGTLGFELGGVYGFPGVPLLMRDLVEGIVGDFRGAPLHKQELLTGLREGEIAPLLTRTQAEHPDVAIGSYPVLEAGAWHVRLVLRASDPARLHTVAGLRREGLLRAAPGGRR